MGTDAEPPGCLRFAPQRGLCRRAARRDPRHLGGAGSSNCSPTRPAACPQHSKRQPRCGYCRRDRGRRDGGHQRPAAPRSPSAGAATHPRTRIASLIPWAAGSAITAGSRIFPRSATCLPACRLTRLTGRPHRSGWLPLAPGAGTPSVHRLLSVEQEAGGSSAARPPGPASCSADPPAVSRGACGVQ